MKTPAFWYKPSSVQATALSPLGWLYGAATARRLRAADAAYRPSVPVICVGNINAGGTGKTPTVQFLADFLKGQGHNPFILSRGYGGALKGPVAVDTARHTAADVGDEPLLLAAHAPVIVGRDRVAGAKLAEGLGADVIVMDDGFQSPALAKALSILVVDAGRGFGNGRCIPAGPLREPAAVGLRRADIVLTIGTAAQQRGFARTHAPLPAPHMRGRLTVLSTGMPWQGLPVLAFAGIGHPDKFFDTLKTLGVDLRRTVALGDHQPIPPPLLARLLHEAETQAAQLVTTEKDAVRLPQKDRAKVLTVPVRLKLDTTEPLTTALAKIGLYVP